MKKEGAARRDCKGWQGYEEEERGKERASGDQCKDERRKKIRAPFYSFIEDKEDDDVMNESLITYIDVSLNNIFIIAVAFSAIAYGLSKQNKQSSI